MNEIPRQVKDQIVRNIDLAIAKLPAKQRQWVNFECEQLIDTLVDVFIQTGSVSTLEISPKTDDELFGMQTELIEKMIHDVETNSNIEFQIRLASALVLARKCPRLAHLVEMGDAALKQSQSTEIALRQLHEAENQ